MNPRIKYLAGQALDQAVPQTWTTLTAYDLNKFTEVFADLLIRETLDVARAGVEYGDGMEDAVYKYFGVEE